MIQDTGGVRRRLEEAQERCDKLAQLASDAERAVLQAEHLAQATSLGPGGATRSRAAGAAGAAAAAAAGSTETTALGELNEGRHGRRSRSPFQPSFWDGDSCREVGRCWALCSSPGPTLVLGDRVLPQAAMAREDPWGQSDLPQARDGRMAGLEAFPVYEWQSHDLPLQSPADSQAERALPLAKTAGVTLTNDALLADRHLDAIQRMNAFAPASATRASSSPPRGQAGAALPAGGDEATRRGVFDKSPPQHGAPSAKTAVAWSRVWNLRNPATAGTLGHRASAAATKTHQTLRTFEDSHRPGTFGHDASTASTKKHQQTLRMMEFSHQMPDPVWLEGSFSVSRVSSTVAGKG